MIVKGVFLIIATFVYSTSALPPCACTRNFKPVCGSDGNTYSNECMLNCVRESKNNELAMISDGSCDTPVPDNCICTLEYRPVCGTDGNTYPNRCSLNCRRSDVRLKHEGQCTEESHKVPQPPCICTREMKPVCGSDGNTYSNPCMLNCATQYNPMLSIQHTGICDDKVRVVDVVFPEPPSCACTRNLRPVCASNGVTYNNQCLMKCADKYLTITKDGPCEE